MQYSEDMYAQKLREFFERHDPMKIEIVGDIVDKFPNQQETVFKHLTQLYAKKEGVDDITISSDSIMSIPPSPHQGVG
ncbi:MAG: hypothetical protein R3277_08300 [Brumimicrobium sp.]|nr:hypothetical protein [Brumimicrobium sp.]